MFYKDSQQIYRAKSLASIPWLIHGFATRHADIPAQFERLATLKQIHSADCIFADGRTGVLGQGDALIENEPGAVVAVRTADCIPILIVDEERRVVAAVHAGWRGTVAAIAARAVQTMHERFGCPPADLRAAIGPGIGKCCFEVGPEVAVQFGAQGRTRIDLEAHNLRVLLEAGLKPERVEASGLCTVCMAQDFHSYRRDREAAGRCYSFAGIRQAVQ